MAAAVQEQADSTEETTLPFYTLPFSLSSSKRVVAIMQIQIILSSIFYCWILFILLLQEVVSEMKQKQQWWRHQTQQSIDSSAT